ncbi:MAG: hypothetical protein V1792_21040 [Pseudomonadota bacterium]
MVEVIFTFEVAKEKQADFLGFVKTGTKPYWESNGCSAYNVWQAVGENVFMKRMEFPDVETMGKVISKAETDAEAKALVEKFESLVTNLNRKPYVKLT